MLYQAVMTAPSTPHDMTEPSSPADPSIALPRLRHTLGVLAIVVVVELALWRFFLRSSYYREIFTPIAGLVLLLAAWLIWKTMRPRTGEERREDDRRHEERRHTKRGR